MFGFDEGAQSYDQVYNNKDGQDGEPDNKGSFGHEVIAGAAAFGGMKLFEDQQRKEGKTVDHAFAKEMVAGFAGGEVDKLAETHGMNEVDRLRANHQAKEQAKDLYDQHYGGQDGYDPSYGQPPQMDQYKNDN